jgi:hypothetical protein
VYIAKMKRWVASTTILTILAIGVWLSAPQIAIKFLATKGQEQGWQVTATSAKLLFNSIEFRGVVAQKSGNNAKIDVLTVHLRYFKPIKIEISEASIHLSEKLTVGQTTNQQNNNPRPPIVINKLSITCDGVYGNAYVKDGHAEITTIGAVSIKAHIAGISGMGLTATFQDITWSENKFTADSFDVHRTSNESKNNKPQSFPNTVQILNFPIKFAHLNKIAIVIDGYKADAEDVTIEFNPNNIVVTLKRARAVIKSLDGQIEISDSKLEFTYTALSKAQSLSVKLNANSISGEIDAVSHERIKAQAVSLNSTLLRDDKAIKLTSSEFKTGTITLTTVGEFKNKQEWDFNIVLGNELTDIKCQDLIKSLPEGVIGIISDFKFVGTFGASFKVTMTDDKPTVKIYIRNKCQIVTAPPKADIKKFRHRFMRSVPDITKNGFVEIESGPGTSNWIPLELISSCMPKAVVTTEDPAFEKHSGFIIQALENATVDNLRTRKFLRGGSTISMQLAKNLWLARTKTLARKFQELFLTTYLEQSLSKERIMELYLNVVEFGPGIYGVGPAARHYFDKSAVSLSLGECVFLASVLPAPRRSHFNSDGSMHPTWTSYLRMIMKMMYDHGVISENDLTIGLAEVVHKGSLNSIHTLPIMTSNDGVDPSSWE